MAESIINESDIPQRSDIEEKDKWDLTILFKNDSEWDKCFSETEKELEKVGQYAGHLAKSPEKLYECLELQSEISKISFNLYQYARLSQDLDNRVSKYQAMTEKAAMLTAKAGAAFSFVEPELLEINDEKLIELADLFPHKDKYDFYIAELIRSREHVRSKEVEELLAQSTMIARGPESIFTMLDDADLKYPSIKDENGNEIQLTKQRFAKMLESSNQRVRHDAHVAVYSEYKKHINMLGASYASSVNKDLFYARARKFNSCVEQALDTYNIPLSVYNSLIETTESNLGSFHKWMGLRKKILKLEQMNPYDIFCPLFPDQNFEIIYGDAVNEVLEAVKPLGEKYGSVLKEAFEKRWVDVYETEGKGSGAYNWGNYTAHPFVLMNFDGTMKNMFTLAHEMGHAMHSYLSCQNQPFSKFQYSIFVAEVASTLNEGLLLQHLLKKSSNEKRKLFLLNRHIDNTMGTYFHQVFFAHFELKTHELVEKSEALSPDKINEIWEELTKKYYGPEVVFDEYSRYKWSRIPHFYKAFYVYQYATSYAASQAILDKFLAGEEGIIDRYLGLLSSGGSDYPINQLKMCGVDMTTASPFEATIKLFGKLVDEVEKLTGV
ncbi:MAG: oligoendopeptidase F [Candidatus Zixiibacteriota bacterium]